MAAERIETPSRYRFAAFCLASAVLSLVVVVRLSVNAWFVFPTAIAILAGLAFLDGYWQSRS